jgi:hypothetical protein
MDEDGH